jgi:hypothetical protein
MRGLQDVESIDENNPLKQPLTSRSYVRLHRNTHKQQPRQRTHRCQPAPVGGRRDIKKHIMKQNTKARGGKAESSGVHPSCTLPWCGPTFGTRHCNAILSPLDHRAADETL